MSEVPPILLSAVVCERVIFDKISGMPSVINIIQNINAPRYPLRYPMLVFFCELTNGHGKTKIKTRLVEAQKEDKVLFEQEREVGFKDVRQVLSMAVNFQGTVFNEPGEYRFQIFAEGFQKLMSLELSLNPPMIIHPAPPPPPPVPQIAGIFLGEEE